MITFLFLLLAPLCAFNIFAVTPARYVAKLTATSGNVPTAVVLENTLSGPLVWTRITEGRYRCTLAQAFTDESKIAGLREYHFVDGGGKWRLYWDDETETTGDSLILESYNPEGVLSDGILVYSDIRIEVFP